MVLSHFVAFGIACSRGIVSTTPSSCFGRVREWWRVWAGRLEGAEVTENWRVREGEGGRRGKEGRNQRCMKAREA